MPIVGTVDASRVLVKILLGCLNGVSTGTFILKILLL